MIFLLLDNRLDFFEELNSLSESLQKLIQRNIQETVVINGSLIGFGLLNWLAHLSFSIAQSDYFRNRPSVVFY